MADMRTPEPGRRSEPIGPQDRRRPIEIEDTPLHNPLPASVRDRVARQFKRTAGLIDAGAVRGPDRDVLVDQGLQAPDLRRLAEQIRRDVLPFRATSKMRTLLSHAEDHELRGAGAALDAVLSDALPQRREALDREIARVAAEKGFVIQTVPGRAEPLPLPHFAFTRGLGANASHPELVIVGIPVSAMQWVLRDLSNSILAGERVLKDGDEIDGCWHPASRCASPTVLSI